jgi:BMFP domain-containing protein YqiC
MTDTTPTAACEDDMQTENRFLDDLARAASGAVGALGGLRNEVEAQFRSRLEAWLKAQHVVTREEFDAVKEMASKARLENEALAARIAELERKLAEKSA